MSLAVLDAGRFAVIGNPVMHSKSPAIHAAFAVQTGINLHYEALEAPVDGFAAALRQFVEQGGRGANVTVPFKLDACTLASRLSPRAALAGAANTLRVEASELYGDNTDGAGLMKDLQRLLADDDAVRGKSVLLLGAGGAARGVLGPLQDAMPARLALANRSQDKADALAAHFFRPDRIAVEVLPLSSLDIERFDIVINSTSASLSGETLDVSAECWSTAELVYDMMYGAGPEHASTVFLRHAATRGARRTADGLGMLVEQAAESFLIWHGVRPATGPVLAQLRAALSA